MFIFMVMSFSSISKCEGKEIYLFKFYFMFCINNYQKSFLNISFLEEDDYDKMWGYN